MAKVILLFKEKVRGEFGLPNPSSTVGRSADNDIHIDNLGVSRKHCRIVQQGNHFLVEDLGSNNGTWLNGNRINAITPLKDGDVIGIGKHHLQFVAGGRQAAPQKQSPAAAQSADSSADFDGTVFISAGKEPPPMPANVGTPGAAAFLSLLSSGDSVPGGRTRFDLSETMTLGKSSGADVRLSGFFTPGIAAVITQKADGFRVRPMGGWFKPRLNGAKLTRIEMLSHGDLLEIRNFRFKFNLK
ncbi:MAG: FHA domain-containing protein [Magnetococcales bacterium]|nr:FHA domain-containing protein [Magnetococcales bacterium]